MKKHATRQFWVTLMKFSFAQSLVMLLLVGVSYAYPSNAQEYLNRRLTLRADNQEIKKVLADIEKSTEVRFVYSSQVISPSLKVSIQKNDVTLGEVLDNLLKPLKIPRKVFSHPAFRYLVATAAVVAIALGVDWYLPGLQSDTPSVVSKSGPVASLLVETSNPTRQPLRVWLSDSSEVLLSPNSHLRYPSQFTDSARVVYLSGEASFSVNRQNRPFLVVTGEMITKVLGTRFVVSAYDHNAKITVQVQSGKVSVYRADPDRAIGSKEVNGLILTANQAAIFEKSLHYLTKTLVTNPVPIHKKVVELDARYDEVPLPDILHELETSYGITIQFDEQNFKHCRITATLSNETLYEKLDLLCKTVSASYEIVDGQIVVSGEGCR